MEAVVSQILATSLVFKLFLSNEAWALSNLDNVSQINFSIVPSNFVFLVLLLDINF
nr:hypothetical protein BN993_00818 [Virgibacillus halodenitrificans]